MILRERHLLGGYREAWRLRSKARARRRQIQRAPAQWFGTVGVGAPPFGLTSAAYDGSAAAAGTRARTAPRW